MLKISPSQSWEAQKSIKLTPYKAAKNILSKIQERKFTEVLIYIKENLHLLRKTSLWLDQILVWLLQAWEIDMVFEILKLEWVLVQLIKYWLIQRIILRLIDAVEKSDKLENSLEKASEIINEVPDLLEQIGILTFLTVVRILIKSWKNSELIEILRNNFRGIEKHANWVKVLWTLRHYIKVWKLSIPNLSYEDENMIAIIVMYLEAIYERKKESSIPQLIDAIISWDTSKLNTLNN